MRYDQFEITNTALWFDEYSFKIIELQEYLQINYFWTYGANLYKNKTSET